MPNTLTTFLVLFFIFCYEGLCEERTVVIGPRIINAGTMDEFTITGPTWLYSLSEPLSMSSYRVRVLDNDGKELPQETIFLHHLIIMGTNRNLPCPQYRNMNVVISAGAELRDVEIPYPFAYKIKPGDRWMVSTHMVNPSDQDVEYLIEYTMEISDWTNELTPVEGYYNSVLGCSNTFDFDVPKNTSASNFVIDLEFPCTFNGTLVSSGAHLHRGAKSLSLSRVNTGELLYNFNVHYDDEKHPEFITSIEDSSQMVSLEIGEMLRLSATYDCSEKIEGAMGVLFAFAKVDNLFHGVLPQNTLSNYQE